MIARRSPIILLALGASALMLSGCASGGDAGFCGPLHDEHETAAVAFVALVPGMNTEAEAQTRLDLVEKLEPTPELTDHLTSWTDYLTVGAESIDDDPTAVIDAYDDAEASGKALFEYYKGTCLQ
jgi:hypothetical protein